jgi:hypothetical protein
MDDIKQVLLESGLQEFLTGQHYSLTIIGSRVFMKSWGGEETTGQKLV